MPIPLLVAAGLKIAGKIAEGRAKGRLQEAELNRQQDLSRAAADRQALEATRFNRAAPDVRLSQSTRGDIAANLSDFTLSGSGKNLTSTGGLRPSLIQEGTRRLGSEISRNALLSQLGREQSIAEGRYGVDEQNPIFGGKDAYTFSPTFTQPTPLPRAGKLDKILGGLGLAGQGLEFLQGQGVFKKKPISGRPIPRNPDPSIWGVPRL